MAYTLNDIYSQIPSPPHSPFSEFIDFEKNEPYICEQKLEKLPIALSPMESPITISEDEILRRKFIDMIEEGIQINDEMTPYQYAIEKLHSIGKTVINKKTKDAVPLRVYEKGKDSYEDFWVHPIFLSLQSFQFFKLFEEIQNNKEQGIIEIEVPSLKTFAFVLYWIYTGDISKILEIGKLDSSYCKGIMENIECLDIKMENF